MSVSEGTTQDDAEIRRNIVDMCNLTLSNLPITNKPDTPDIIIDTPIFWEEFFRVLNFSINMADCQKDGTPMTNLINFRKKNVDQFVGIAFSKVQLKQMIHAVKRQYLVTGEIKRVLVARSEKGGESTFKHFDDSRYIVAYDCGYIGFLRRDIYRIVQTFGKYIDPSSSRICDISFPLNSFNLSIDHESLKYLGYNYSSITRATSVGNDKYDYNITIAKKPLTNDSKTERGKDKNINNIFVGNAKKNTDDIVSVLGKNMGDKFQVFIQFINYKLNKDVNDQQYSVATCDEVVLFLCIILNLPCFYTSIDEVELNGVKDVKVNEILHYDPDGANFGNALKRLIEEYKVVNSEYEYLKDLLSIASNKPVYLGGYDMTVKLHPMLVSIMIDDLTKIQKYIKEILYDPAITKFEELYETIPLVSKVKEEIAAIKFATNIMTAFTTRIIDMCPNTVIKLRGNSGEPMFNQTTCEYYDYGANSNLLENSDEVILEEVIGKKYIVDFYAKTKTSLPNKNATKMTFSEIVIMFSKFEVIDPSYAPTSSSSATIGGGKNLAEYLHSSPGGFDKNIGNIIFRPEDINVTCWLDSGYYSVPATTLSSKSSVSSLDEKLDEKLDEILQRRRDTGRESFNVYEKYYDELYDIYVKIHEDYDEIRKFTFDDYVDAIEPLLFKTRNYYTITLRTKMEFLQSKFLLDFVENAKNELISLLKINFHDELIEKVRNNLLTLKPTSPQTIEEEDVYAIIDVEDPTVKYPPKTSKEYTVYMQTKDLVKGEITKMFQENPEQDSTSIIYNLSLDPDLLPRSDFRVHAGGRIRVKTRKRLANFKQTHKRVHKIRIRKTKRRNKRGQKKHRTR